jgi:hypothetical protein
MHRIIFVLALSFCLMSCVQSYTVPRATIHLQVLENSNIESVKHALDKFLVKKQFINNGIDEHTLSVFTRISNGQNKNQFQIDHIEKIKKTISYKNESLDVRVQSVDFSNLDFKKKHTQYEYSEITISDKPALELNIYNSRPGGFSTEAFDFYNELMTSTEITDTSDIIVIYSPPKTNQKEFYTFKVLNILSLSMWWTGCFLLFALIFMAATKRVIKGSNLANNTKKGLFIIGGVTLFTPFPFPLSMFGIFFLPSLFAVSEIGSDYFWKLQPIIIPSYFFSLLLFFFIARKIFKDG